MTSALFFARQTRLGTWLLRRSTPIPSPTFAVTRTYGLGSHVSDNDPEVVEKAQRRHLEGKTKSRFPKDAPGWDEELASDSEAIVKAERSTHDTADIKEMQRETVECLAQEKEELGEGTPNVKDEQGPR